MRLFNRLLVCSALISACVLHALADEPTIRVHVDRPGARISPRLYGVFFEEINHAGDGGLYAEMVRNGSFENSATAPVGWAYESARPGTAAIDDSRPLNENNRHSLRIVT